LLSPPTYAKSLLSVLEISKARQNSKEEKEEIKNVLDNRRHKPWFFWFEMM